MHTLLKFQTPDTMLVLVGWFNIISSFSIDNQFGRPSSKTEHGTIWVCTKTIVACLRDLTWCEISYTIAKSWEKSGKILKSQQISWNFSGNLEIRADILDILNNWLTNCGKHLVVKTSSPISYTLHCQFLPVVYPSSFSTSTWETVTVYAPK